MPFDVYNEFFALSNTLYCEGCNDDLINAKSYTGSERKYTFEDVCNYINENRMKNYHGTYAERPEYVPLLGYFILILIILVVQFIIITELFLHRVLHRYAKTIRNQNLVYLMELL